MTTINPVEIVCNFLKSENGRKIMASLGTQHKHIDIGKIDDGKSRIILTGAGFRKKQGRTEMQATAYDVEDAMNNSGVYIEILQTFVEIHVNE